MAHSLEVRPPFLDHRIIEFAATLPIVVEDSRGSEQKYVLTRIDETKPHLIHYADATKVGFDIPTHEWFRGHAAQPAYGDARFCAEAEYSDLFRFDTIRNLTKLHMNRSISIGYHLWGLMTCVSLDEAMEDKFSDSPPIKRPDVHDWFVSRRRVLLVVALFAAAVYLGCILSPPSLMDDVDAVQAQIARNMLSSGDWVTAHLDGVPFLEKPPLIYWTIAVSYAVFGAHDWAARIPEALSAILLCLVTAAFGIWAFGKRAGLYAGLCMSTCIGLFLFTRILLPGCDAHLHHRPGSVGAAACIG